MKIINNISHETIKYENKCQRLSALWKTYNKGFYFDIRRNDIKMTKVQQSKRKPDGEKRPEEIDQKLVLY